MTLLSSLLLFVSQKWYNLASVVTSTPWYWTRYVGRKWRRFSGGIGNACFCRHFCGNGQPQTSRSLAFWPRNIFSSYSQGLVTTLLVYCYSGCGCCYSIMPKVCQKKLQLAEATKRRKLLYTSSTDIINNCCFFYLSKTYNNYRKKSFHAPTTKHTLL